MNPQPLDMSRLQPAQIVYTVPDFSSLSDPEDLTEREVASWGEINTAKVIIKSGDFFYLAQFVNNPEEVVILKNRPAPLLPLCLLDQPVYGSQAEANYAAAHHERSYAKKQTAIAERLMQWAEKQYANDD